MKETDGDVMSVAFMWEIIDVEIYGGIRSPVLSKKYVLEILGEKHRWMWIEKCFL